MTAIDGVRVTTPAETLLAAARDLGVLDLVIMADSALRLGQVTPTELKIAAGQRRRGAPLLRRVIPLLDAQSESPWESVLRVLHEAAEISVQPQYEIRDATGRFVARADLWIVGTRRIHEYDGGFHRDIVVHHADLVRDRTLIQAGWQRFGFTSTDLLSNGAAIIAGADRLLKRPWDRARLDRWEDLLTQSLFRKVGRSRALQHWRRTL